MYLSSSHLIQKSQIPLTTSVQFSLIVFILFNFTNYLETVILFYTSLPVQVYVHAYQFLPALSVKNLSAMQETRVQSLGRSTGKGNGYPLQYSCLENSMDREAWWTTLDPCKESYNHPGQHLEAETSLCQQRSIQSKLWYFQQSCTDLRGGA